MASEDKAPFELDLSLPEGSLDDAVWNRIVEDALAMSPSETDASIVPEFDEADEVVLNDEDLTEVALEADDADFTAPEEQTASESEFEDPDFSEFDSEAELGSELGIDPSIGVGDAGEFSPELDGEADLNFE